MRDSSGRRLAAACSAAPRPSRLRLPRHDGSQQASLAAWLPRVQWRSKGNANPSPLDYGSSFLHINNAEASIARPPSSGHASLPPCAVLYFRAVLRSPWWRPCVGGGGCDIWPSLEFGPWWLMCLLMRHCVCWGAVSPTLIVQGGLDQLIRLLESISPSPG